MIRETTQHRIDAASGLYAQHAAELAKHAPFVALLRAYRAAIDQSGAAMGELGVAGKCGDCAAEGPGSCCSQSVEDWYDSMLLFVNLLLGCDLAETRPLAVDCHFVGPQGCTLVARHYFCVQFLCPALKEQLGRAGTQRLLAVVGQELLLGSQLEQLLHRWLQSRQNLGSPASRLKISRSLDPD
jgi:hypothetical protein